MGAGLDQLSDELLLHVLLPRFTGEDLARLECVCTRYWRRVSLSDVPIGERLRRGDTVALHGLTSAAGRDLNGRPARVLSWDEASSRYFLNVEGEPRKKRLQPSNLKLALSLAEAAARAAVLSRADQWRVQRRQGENWKLTLQALRDCLPPLRTVAAGSMHTACLSRGTLFTCGFGSFGQLGHGPPSRSLAGAIEQDEQQDTRHAITAAPRPSIADLEDFEHVKELSFRAVDTATRRSHVEPYDHHDVHKVVVPQRQPAPASVACGGMHSAYIAGNGELYTWGRVLVEGSGAGGQARDQASVLGHFPTVVPSSPQIVLCRPWHVCCDGQGLKIRLAVPRSWDLVAKVAVVSLRDSHAACITDEGELFTWGSGWGLGHHSLCAQLDRIWGIVFPIPFFQIVQ